MTVTESAGVVTVKPHVIDVPLLLVLIAATLLGTLGNGLVIGAILVNKVTYINQI